jgi:hypothetical protein
MRFLTFKSGAAQGIGVLTASGEVRGLAAGGPGYPGHLGALLSEACTLVNPVVDDPA